MSETCGGCVYDGRPLPGVGVTVVDAPAGSGRVGGIMLAGAVVARGYRGRPGDPAFTPGPARSDARVGPGSRRFTTGDLGRWVGGRLEVVGRADDVLITGGLKVDPAVVEAALRTVAGVADAALTAVPDPTWGQLLVAVIACDPREQPDPVELRRAARAAAGRAATPRMFVQVGQIPRRGIGKPDRPALAALASASPRDPGVPASSAGRDQVPGQGSGQQCGIRGATRLPVTRPAARRPGSGAARGAAAR